MDFSKKSDFFIKFHFDVNLPVFNKNFYFFPVKADIQDFLNFASS